ncbi:MAG: S-ribosylhomocysteine lyase [Oscillospiraceae bacterium]|nr:S-ribosylhomocysteine lyase [Oscillospiraceae bacterium]
MERIASFQVDHNKIGVGMYVSRVDGDITTFDIRLVRPNCGEYPTYAAMHTIEHLFATYARNSKYADSIIYVGPMGCRTGFYLLTRDLDYGGAITLVHDSFEFILGYDGDIPGVSARECGNYLEHDLEQAKHFVTKVTKVLQNYTPSMLSY